MAACLALSARHENVVIDRIKKVVIESINIRTQQVSDADCHSICSWCKIRIEFDNNSSDIPAA
jgi:hypothetical protein